MSKKNIEERDTELLNRYKQAVQKKNIPIPPERHINQWTVIFLSGACFISFLLVYFIAKDSTPVLDSKVVKEVSRVGTNPSKKLAKREIVPFVSKKTRLEDHPPPKPTGNTIAESKAIPKVLVIKRETAEVPIIKSKRPRINEIVSSAAPMVEQPYRKSRKREGQNIFVENITVCKNILDRMPVGKQQTFSLRKDRTVVVWTEVKSKTIPGKIKHIYYLNGKKYLEVPLALTYSRMRTWSRITLRNKAQVGLWRVAVVLEDGELIKEVTFTVGA